MTCLLRSPLTSAVQGLCAGRPEFNTQPIKLLRLWLHETYRVFSDRMVDAAGSWPAESLQRY